MLKRKIDIGLRVYQKGFTLVELAISIAILSVLAMSGMTTFQDYIMKSKLAEGNLKIRQVYDLQAVFGVIPLTTEVRNSASQLEVVTCRRVPRFASITGVSYLNDFEAYDPDAGGLADGISFTPPARRKLKTGFYGNDNEGSRYRYNASTGVCSANPLQAIYGDYKFLDLLAEGDFLRLSWREVVSLPTSSSESDSYFLLSASTSQFIADEYGADVNDTLLIGAYADFDGDFNPENLDYFDLPGSKSILPTNSRYPFDFDELTIVARGMYTDAEGNIRGTEMIQLNLGE